MEKALAYNKLSKLPAELQSEVMDFIDFLLSKQGKEKQSLKPANVYPGINGPLDDYREYMEMSAAGLAKDWLTKKEDEAWQDL